MTNDATPKKISLPLNVLTEMAKEKGDCRLCSHYSFDRDIDVEFFECNKGHFRYTDYGGNHIEGEMKWFACKGDDFFLDQSSRWWPYLREDIEKEAKKKVNLDQTTNQNLVQETEERTNYDANELYRMWAEYD